MGLASESGEKPHGDGHNSNAGRDTLNSSDSSKALKKESFEGDFIIISEFSEVVGPVHLYIIPEGAEGSFNVSSFVLKIMAVDFQNKSNDPQSYLKDSQVFMPEPNEDAYTYLHHFNLLDVYARGYVRPMCISYITHDREKIMDNFQELMTKVSKITRIMKRGNHRLFLKDLEERMADVRYTQTMLNSNTVDLENTSPTPTTVNEYLADLEVLHQKFHRAVTLKQLRRANSKSARARLQHSNPHLSPPQSTTLHAHNNDDDEDDDEDEFEGEEEREEREEREKEEGENEKQKVVKSINKAVAELISRDYQPQVLTSLHPRTLHGKLLRDLHGLCDGNSVKSLSLLKSLHRHYSRPSTVLSLEAYECPSLLPSSSLLTIGQAVVLNFNLEIDKHMNKVVSHELERAASTTMNNSNTTSKDTSSSLDDDSSSYGSPYSMGSIASSPAHDDEAFANEVVKIANGLSASGAPDSDAHFLVNSSQGDEGMAVGDTVTNDEKSVGTPKQRPSPHAQFFSSYLWPTSPHISSQSTANLQRTPSGNLQNIPNLPAPTHNHPPQSSSANLQGVPGKGLLELRGKVVWLRHIVYSILRGRPVVVLGSLQNESAVRGIVQALSIFVAGNNAGIAPWRTKPLKMSDLASFKLLGLVRSCTIPKAVEKYVTIFDFESDVLKAPPYPTTGKFIDEIFSLRRFWPDELSYLAHVHYVLFDIGVKSCLYYHLCCVTVHQLTPQQASQAHNYIHPHYHSSSPNHLVNSHSYSHYPSPSSAFSSSSTTSSSHHHGHYRSYSPRYPYTPSPHPHPSQPPSPYPYPIAISSMSQPPSPHQLSQPPSPRHATSQPPSPRRPQNNNNTVNNNNNNNNNNSNNTLPSTFSPAASIPSPYSIPPSSVSSIPPSSSSSSTPQTQQTTQQQSPQNVFVPVYSPVMAPEPRKEIRPEPIRLDRSVELSNTLLKTETEQLPKMETEPPKQEKQRPRADSRIKGTVGSLQAPVRSHSMPSIDKYRPNTNNNNNNNTNSNISNNTNNASNSSGNISTNNVSNNNIISSNVHRTSPQSSLTYPPHYPPSNSTNINININGSGNIPQSHHSYKGDEWRNNSSPSVSRHSSWQYGKSLHSQGHRSLSDSQINPFWLPPNPTTRDQIRVQFFRSMDISQGDSDIVMYLAEVVKEQQATEVQGTETPVIRLDYSNCQVFHSKKGVTVKEK